MMRTHEQATHALADRVGCPEGPAERRREALEATLLPMVRCALRTGRGHPRLLQWLRGALPSVAGPAAGPVDHDRAAGSVARMLCSAMLEQVRGGRAGVGAMETLVGA
jgi:hypothetical protein